MGARAKHWCFTIPNYTQASESAAAALFSEGVVTYLVYGRETSASGLRHLQGYCSFPDRKRKSQVRLLIPPSGHWESAKGTPQQASDYCKKDGDFVEFGDIPSGQGTRTDIQEFNAAIDAGADRDTLREQHTACYFKYARVADALVLNREKGRDWVVDVQVFWGKTGRGKTRAVFEFIEHSEIYVHPGSSWFNGYEGQKVALFDDFNGSEFKLSYMLKLLDRYPMKVPVKGGFVNWVPKHIFITSNKDPKEWYANAHEEQRAALFRRFSLIKHFD